MKLNNQGKEGQGLGAYAMTTKCLDNKICNFNILLSWRFPGKKKQHFWTIFLSAPISPPSKKRKFYFYCRLAVSDTMGHTEGAFTGTPVNVGHLRQNSGGCRRVLVNMAIWVCQSSPEFAKLRQSSHEGAHMLLVHPGTCLTKRGA